MTTATLTVADILTGRERPVRILVCQNNGREYWIVGQKIVHWLRRYQRLEATDQGVSCGQRHYTITCDDFVLATIACEVAK